MAIVMKSAPVRIVTKAADDGSDDSGVFDAIVAAFGNTDLQGEVTDRGAFADSLKAYADAGKSIPILWSHDWDDPFSHIGAADATKAEETDEGLLLKDVTLDLDNPRAAQVWRLLKSGRVAEFSYAAATPDDAGAWSIEEDTDGRVVTHLRKLDLIEAGPTLKGANPNTRVVGMKSATPTLRDGTPAPVVKAGRVLAAKHVDTLSAAVTAAKALHKDLGALLDAVKAPESDDTGKDTTKSATGGSDKEEPRRLAKAGLDAL